MADLSITEIEPVSTVTPVRLQVGEAVSEHDLLRYKSSDGKYYQAKASGGTEDAEPTHIALSAAALDGYIIALPLDAGLELKLTGPSLTVGDYLVVSANAGKTAPDADLATGNYFTPVFVATAATTVVVNKVATGVTMP